MEVGQAARKEEADGELRRADRDKFGIIYHSRAHSCIDFSSFTSKSSNSSQIVTFPPRCRNRGDEPKLFELEVNFKRSTAKLADGSMRAIDHNIVVNLQLSLDDFDPQALVDQEEKAVRDIVERIGESIPWGPYQEVQLVRYDDWKGEYVRMEVGEALVDEIQHQLGFDNKHATLLAELVDLKSDSRVGYVASKRAMQIEDDEWAASIPVRPIATELTVLADDAEERALVAANEVSLTAPTVVDWN